MKGFRSICFIHDKKNSYTACYLKEYFKWIGLSFVDYVYNEENNIFDEPEDCKFDIIVNIDHAMPNLEIEKVEKAISPRFIELQTTEAESEGELLKKLLENITRQFLKGERCKALIQLADIYNRNHLVEGLYEYTFVLLERLYDDMKELYYQKFENVYEEVLKILEKCDQKCENCQENRFIEYALYAKYNCQRCMNAILLLQKKIVRFEVEQYLDEVSEIYEYDSDYYNVEYLKAQVAQQDWQFKAFSKFYIIHCIERCQVNVCKSYHYYSLGKWKDKNMQFCEAEENYRLAYYHNKSNIKAIFKIAVEKNNMNEEELSKVFLNKILNLWSDEDNKDYIPLRDIEYAYKARMLLSDIEEKQFQDFDRNNAEKYSEYVQNIRMEDDNISGKSFIKRMYPEKAVRNSICDAMMQRVYFACSVSE